MTTDTTAISFTVSGQPLPKERPRLGRGGAVYTPAKTLAWESQVGWAARQAMQYGGLELLTGDVKVTLKFYRKGNRRVDIDNLAKAALDGLNGVTWDDDKQVTQLTASVVYGDFLRFNGVTVLIEECE